MLRKFLDGMMFGAGFTLSFVVIVAVAGMLFTTFGPTSQLAVSQRESIAEAPSATGPVPFYELPIEQQIERASVIALVRYQSGEDGRMEAVLSEILKKGSDVEFFHSVGDEYVPLSHYPRPNENHGEGAVVFFDGSPAQMRSAMSYSGDRIPGLGDMPIELLKKKCAEQSAS